MNLFISLLFILAKYVTAVHCKEIYISSGAPSQQDTLSCQDHCCISLSQFSEGEKCNGSDTNISLIFLPGNHSLDTELYISGAYNVSMQNTAAAKKVFVECTNQLGRLNISETTFASVSGLYFVGCEGNRVSDIESFIVEDTTFEGVEGGGTALWLKEVTTASIIRSAFLFNGQQQSYHELDGIAGGALNILSSSNISIDSSNFTCNEAGKGGAIFIQNSSLSIVQSNFSHNKANTSGGVIVSSYSSINISNSHFSANGAGMVGGVMETSSDSYKIGFSSFTNNGAKSGGVISAPDQSSFNITESSFSGNNASFCGGVVAITLQSLFHITASNFSNNNADYGGVIDLTSLEAPSHSLISTISSSFTYNQATLRGGVIFVDIRTENESSTFSIINNTFTNNNATYGGALDTFGGNFTIIDNVIANNTGGVLCSYLGSFVFIDSNFIANIGQNNQGILFVFECSVEITNCTFDGNFGSLYTFGSNLTIIGHAKFENSVEQAYNILQLSDHDMRKEGGAITSFQSAVIFTGNSSLSNNRARDGGAILATESTISVYGEISLSNNTGGAISLQQSELEVKGSCIVSNNNATRGGGIHATGSSISVYQSGILHCINNSAVNGSGMYLEVNSKLYVLRRKPRSSISEDLLVFEGNHASYAGGAVYVADETSSGSCLPDVECFIQTLALYPMENIHEKNISIHFSDTNMATEQGSNIFGGLLDRCIASPFAETNQVNTNNGSFTYIQNISDIELDSISSLPVRVCFCTNNGTEPDCSYQPLTIKVKKGEAFTVSLVAVDQVNHSVAANIVSSVSGTFDEGQQIQAVKNKCTNLTYNIYSKKQNESIKLYADGPCGSSLPGLSVRELGVDFTDCTCPVGFMPSNKNPTKCECVCHMALSSYITDCNSTTFLLKKNSNSWITYTNDSSHINYVTHRNCPIGYCKTDVNINLNLPNGADAQCANNRRGVLCGACQNNFSLSLGSTRCLSCPNLWPLTLIAIILTAIIAGILLVIALLAINMTVAVGLINGFIFYANIATVNSAVFFPSSEPSFPTVFVAWLNLDIGVDACFSNGLNAYIKTWLQLAFPIYMIVLVILVIIASECSPRFAALIGKRDPIATLATLILLSYAKLLSVSINALSFATLHYQNSKETVWLPDGNVSYFKREHAVLATVALLIMVVIVVPYTLLLFLWQWLVRAPRWKIFKWTRSTKLDAFVSINHEPYNRKYRYWPGLLLLVRVVIYITAAITVSANPQALLLVTMLSVGGLFLFKAVIIGVQVHKKSYVDILETVLLFNLLASAIFTSYHFQMDTRKQIAIAYVSTIITFILLLGVIGYHLFILIKKSKVFFRKQANVEYPLATVQPEVTQSYLVLPRPPEGGSDDRKKDEVGETIQDRDTIIRETFTDEL